MNSHTNALQGCAHPTNAYNRRQAGLTLIEILIVVVILVIGILTVVQLFPTGFDVLRAGQNASAADRLANTALTLVSSGNGTPDGIYAVADAAPTTPGSNLFDPTVAPDDLSQANSIAGVPQNPALNDVDKLRYIRNETFVVKTSSNNPAIPPVHVLNFGPIVVNDQQHPDYNDLSVTSAPWTAVQGNSAPDTTQGVSPATGLPPPVDVPSDTLQPNTTRYMIDYNNGMIAVAPEPYPQNFVFTVTPVGGLPTTVVLTVPTTYNGTVWFAPQQYYPGSPAQPALAGPWVAGTDTLYRPFAYTTTSLLPQQQDPFFYTLVNPNTPPTSNFNVGALYFSPSVSTLSGALSARVSYTAYDWHILHEDHDLPAADVAQGNPPVPGSNNNTVRLAINDVKEVGDIQQDGSVFGGIVPTGTSASAYDFMFVDLDTGLLANYTHGNIYDADQISGPGPSSAQISVSFKNGRLTLPYMYDSGPQSTAANNDVMHHVRIMYEGKLDWGVCVQRAPAKYISVTSVLGAGPTGSITAFNTANALTTGPFKGMLPNMYYYDGLTTIHLPLCDEGKTIELDNVVVKVGATAGNLSSITVVPTQATVSTLSDEVTADLSQVPAVQQEVQTLTTAGATGATTISFGSVAGISARAVVIWREGQHWREHSLDTLLNHA